jgi:RNA polymerase sigma-70 factor (ECF subfamily)
VPEDDETVALAKSGDQAAWAALYVAHAGRLLVWLGTAGTGDPGAATEDVAAEAWLVAAQKIADFTGTSSDFAGWLFGIARKVNANGRRKVARRRTDPHAFGVDDEGDLGRTDGGIDRVDVLDEVRRTLARLSPREADVVACRDVVGLDVAGTAEALGIRPTAVRIAHHRARQRLRGLLDEAGPDRPRACVSEVRRNPATG